MRVSSILGRTLAMPLDLLLPEFPPLVRIETTNHCNADCAFCPRDSLGREKAFMDDVLLRKIVDDCAANGPPIIHLHNFGEPLLDKRLPERVRMIREKGIAHVGIFTNGALLRGSVAERLLDSGLGEIKVSIDGADSREFNRLRAGLELGPIVHNLRLFKQLRDERGLSSPTIVATCSLTSERRETENRLAGVVDRIVYADFHNWAGATGYARRLRVRQPCFRLWRTFTILVNGDVAACCLDHSGRVILGNCREQPIGEIWRNAKYEELRRLHRRSRQAEIPLCDACSMSFIQPHQLFGRLGRRHGD